MAGNNHNNRYDIDEPITGGDLPFYIDPDQEQLGIEEYDPVVGWTTPYVRLANEPDNNLLRHFLGGYSSASTTQNIEQVLAEVIQSQKKKDEFKDYYYAFQLGQISETEYKRIENEYSYTFDNLINEELIQKIRLLLDVTRRSYSSFDIALLFNIDPDDADEILYEISKK